MDGKRKPTESLPKNWKEVWEKNRFGGSVEGKEDFYLPRDWEGPRPEPPEGWEWHEVLVCFGSVENVGPHWYLSRVETEKKQN